VQEYIRIFPSKFNYNKKLLLVSTIAPLSFYENKGIEKNKILDFFIFLLGGGYFYIITQLLANLLVSEYI
jgi:hypothetical protein